MNKSLKVFAPASVANVGSAFDILGFALAEPGDYVIAQKTERKGVTMKDVHSTFGELPLDASRNTASVAVKELLRRKGIDGGVELELHKNMPLGSGLGSSAASAAAALFAAIRLFNIEVTEQELIECGMEAEKVACGSPHADNIAPSLLGGVILIRSYNPFEFVRIDAPKGLHYSVVCPNVVIKTEDARSVLRREVTLQKAVHQMGNVAGLIAGFMKGDLGLIGRSLEDVLIEPERAALIPGFYEVKKTALEHGALGCSISGSGPALFAFSSSMKAAKEIADAMKEHFKFLKIDSLSFFGQVSRKGARVVN